MSTAAGAAYGTLLKYGNGASPETFTTIAEVKKLSCPGIKADTKDVTSHDSASGYKEFISTLIDGGEVKAEVNWIPGGTSHVAMRTDMDNRTPRNFQIVLPVSPSKTFSFTGLVTGFEPSADVSDELAMALTIKVTGKPVLA